MEASENEGRSPPLSPPVQAWYRNHSWPSGRRREIGNFEQHLKTGRFEVNRYAIVIEKANGNYSAYAPDVPGCIATGKTVDETRRKLIAALEAHLELMREAGEPIPQPSTFAEYVEIL
jgi:predicted RNase H-like HicB family nuclease